MNRAGVRLNVMQEPGYSAKPGVGQVLCVLRTGASRLTEVEAFSELGWKLIASASFETLSEEVAARCGGLGFQAGSASQPVRAGDHFDRLELQADELLAQIAESDRCLLMTGRLTAQHFAFWRDAIVRRGAEPIAVLIHSEPRADAPGGNHGAAWPLLGQVLDLRDFIALEAATRGMRRTSAPDTAFIADPQLACSLAAERLGIGEWQSSGAGSGGAMAAQTSTPGVGDDVQRSLMSYATDVLGADGFGDEPDHAFDVIRSKLDHAAVVFIKAMASGVDAVPQPMPLRNDPREYERGYREPRETHRPSDITHALLVEATRLLRLSRSRWRLAWLYNRSLASATRLKGRLSRVRYVLITHGFPTTVKLIAQRIHQRTSTTVPGLKRLSRRLLRSL